MYRSYSDFLWLEHALHQEFHGALLIPHLQLLVQRQQQQKANNAASNQDDVPVESSILKYWLMDVLNGIRGSGEWILPIVQQPQQYPTQNNNNNNMNNHHDGMIDMIHCESFETFFYRHAIPSTPLNYCIENNERNQNSTKKNHRSNGHNVDHDESEAPGCNTDTPFSFLKSFFNVAISPIEFCVGPQPLVDTSTTTNRPPTTAASRLQRNVPNVKLPLSVMNCSSRAIGTASDLNIENSIADTSSINSGFTSLTPIGSTDFVIHSELIFAEKDLALNYVQTSQAALNKLEILLEVENNVGSAWKRFIVSVNNLFSYEKDVENANIGNMKVKRENMPYRKIEKSVIDECLRVMIRQKLDRAVPGLQILSSMISAFNADVSSVETSVNTYTNAIQQVLSGKHSIPPPHDGSTETTSTDSSSSSPTPPTHRTMQKPLRSWDDLKDWTHRTLQTEQKNRDAGIKSHGNDESKKLLILNERRLRLSLTTMFRTAPFRISRIAWRYWHTEASHCAMINSAAAELRTKLDIVNPSSVSKLLKRHSKDEKIDCTKELELIQRIVHLGNGKKFPSATESINDGGSVSTTSINNELVEVDNDDISEERTKAIKRDKALDIARRRIGRWNAVLAMSILEAVGVDDPNVRVEETTRDLRLVRKYAIGLRECLNRCVEALALLKEAVTGRPTNTLNESTPMLLDSNNAENSSPTRLKSVRNDFLIEMSLLFSGVVVDDLQLKRPTNDKRSSTISKAVLHGAGIDTTDPSGWIPTMTSLSATRGASQATAFKPLNNNSNSTPARIGNCAVQYVNTRDAHIEWLISSLDGLFQEYTQRIEVIEGFVYMECVGIQLEKHFSAKRAKALAAFEKKTDLTTAANMARKKRMPQLLIELQGKLDKLGSEVSHTTVKETKEAHLESKNVKAALHDLAMRRLLRAQETSTERVVTILDLWAKEEEINATEEIKALGGAMSLLEKSVCQGES